MGTVNDFYADLGNGDLDEHDFHAQVEKISLYRTINLVFASVTN